MEKIPELLPYSNNVHIAALPAGENIGISPTYSHHPPERFFSDEEISQERAKLLKKPPKRRTYIIGSFSKRIDPATGIMYDKDVEFIEMLHAWHERLNVQCHSAFKREGYGKIGIDTADATALDKLAVATSHVITVLPGTSASLGAWEEIRYGASLGKSFLFLFDENEPEVEFENFIRTILANITTHPMIMFLHFTNKDDLMAQLESVWAPIADCITTDEEWQQVQELCNSDN